VEQVVVIPHSEAVAGAADVDFPTASLLYIGGAGNITVTPWSNSAGGTVTFTAVPAGTVLPLRVKRYASAGLTATNIVRLMRGTVVPA
jgi:hypothetical protein